MGRGDNVIAYLRKYEDEKVVVVVNFQNRSVKAFLKISFKKIRYCMASYNGF